MRIIPLFILIMTTLALVIMPYADGWLMRKSFYNNVAGLQALLDNQHSETKIEIIDYQLGWIKSTAKVMVSNKTDLPVDFIIRHGPIVIVDKKPKIALAYVAGVVRLPRLLGLTLVLTSVIPMDQKVITVKYFLPAFAIGKTFLWDGLIGESIINKSGNLITSVNSNTYIGKMTGEQINPLGGTIAYQIDPMISEINNSRENANDNFATYTLKSGGMTINGPSGPFIKLQSSSLSANSHVIAGMFSSQASLQIANLQTNPMLVPKEFAVIPSIQYSFDIQNLNQANMLGLANQHKEENIVSILTNKTTLNTTFTLQTESGISSMQMDFALTNTPKTYDDLKTMVDGKLQVRVTKPLFNELLSLYLSIMARPTVIEPTAAMPPTSINDPKTLIANWINEGSLTDSGDSYTVVMTKTGNEVMVNGHSNTSTVMNLRGILYGEVQSAPIAAEIAPPTPGEIALASVTIKEQTPDLPTTTNQPGSNTMPALASPPPFVPAKVEDPACLNFPYPQDAKELNITGITTLAVLLDGAGKVIGAKVSQSSGSAYLDNATKDAIKKCTFVHPEGNSWTAFEYYWRLGDKPSEFKAIPQGNIEPPM